LHCERGLDFIFSGLKSSKGKKKRGEKKGKEKKKGNQRIGNTLRIATLREGFASWGGWKKEEKNSRV